MTEDDASGVDLKVSLQQHHGEVCPFCSLSLCSHPWNGNGFLVINGLCHRMISFSGVLDGCCALFAHARLFTPEPDV
jgi:hypothetical protein